jgi:hypothetical protein
VRKNRWCPLFDFRALLAKALNLLSIQNFCSLCLVIKAIKSSCFISIVIWKVVLNFWATSKVLKFQNWVFSDQISVSKSFLSCLDIKVKYFTLSPCSKVWFFLTFNLQSQSNFSWEVAFLFQNRSVGPPVSSNLWSGVTQQLCGTSRGTLLWLSKPQVSFSFKWIWKSGIRNPEDPL